MLPGCMYETEVRILMTQSEITHEPFIFLFGKGELDDELGLDG